MTGASGGKARVTPAKVRWVAVVVFVVLVNALA